jgi:hypothetical protein
MAGGRALTEDQRDKRRHKKEADDLKKWEKGNRIGSANVDLEHQTKDIKEGGINRTTYPSYSGHKGKAYMDRKLEKARKKKE